MADKTEMQNQEPISLLSFDPIVPLLDVLRRWYLIAAIALIAALAAYAGTEFLYQPQYTASTTFVVSMQGSSSSVYQNLTATTNLAATFSEVLNSSFLRKSVVQTLGTGSFNGRIEASAIEETNLLTVRVTDSSPRTAFLATRAIIDNHAGLTRQIMGDVILEVLQQPSVPSAPSNPMRAGSNAKRAAIFAGAASCALLALLSCMRDAVRSTEEASRKLDCRVLGEVHHERKRRTLRRKRTSILITNPLTSFSYTETIRTLRRKFEQHLPDGAKIVMVTSALENEGKSTIAVNLALSLAQKQRRVLLIDCDLRKPACYKILEQAVSRGGTIDVLRGTASLADCVQAYPEAKNLELLLETRAVRNSSKLMSADGMARLISEAKAAYDYVILDTPPMSAGPDSESLADLADASLLVVRQNQAAAAALRAAVDILQSADGQMLGCILNDSRSSSLSGEDSYGYGYGHYGHYGHYGTYGKYGAYASAQKRR